MAVEAKRGCGWRKAGGLYLVAKGIGVPCERLPVPLVPCAACGEVIKQTRGFQWVRPEAALAGAKPCTQGNLCPACPVCTPMVAHNKPPILEDGAIDPSTFKTGLIFCGEKFYPETGDWMKEALDLGVSRRVAAIPKGLVVGKTWVFVAHPKAIRSVETVVKGGPLVKADAPEVVGTPGIFHAFRPTGIELIVTPSMQKQQWVKDLVKQGVTLVEVPENDPDHAPTVAKKSARKRAMEKHARKLAKADDGLTHDPERDGLETEDVEA